jgi:hypothetical protein
MGAQKNTKELMNYNPYNIVNQRDGYADIAFETEGIITVPRTSASNIIDLLNTAFKNGVRMTINSIKTNGVQNETSEVFIKQKPQVEPDVPINLYSKKK